MIDASLNPAHNSRHIAGDEVWLGLAKICLADRLDVIELVSMLLTTPT
jgi:hypothetical protein